MAAIPTQQQKAIKSKAFKNRLAFLQSPQDYKKLAEGFFSFPGFGPKPIEGLEALAIDLNHPTVFVDEGVEQPKEYGWLRDYLKQIMAIAKEIDTVTKSADAKTLQDGLVAVQEKLDNTLAAIRGMSARYVGGNLDDAGKKSSGLFKKFFEGYNSIEGATISYATIVNTELKQMIELGNGGPAARVNTQPGTKKSR